MVALRAFLPGAFWGEVVPYTIRVQVLPKRVDSIVILGVPVASLSETATRVRQAIEAACDKAKKPRIQGQITIDIERTDGGKLTSTATRYASLLDLPMAVGALIWAGYLSDEELVDKVFMGTFVKGDELVGNSAGWISMVFAASGTATYIPQSVVSDGLVQACSSTDNVRTITSLTALLAGVTSPIPAKTIAFRCQGPSGYNFADNSQGHGQAIRAAEIAAMGRHILVLGGGPGRSWAARHSVGILPPLEDYEQVEVLALHDAAGLAPGALCGRPFRAPHYSVSPEGIRGEVRLARHGVLYLDDLSEFTRAAVEVLQTELAAPCNGSIQLVVSVNDCPCGGVTSGCACSCAPDLVQKYRARWADRVRLLTRATGRGALYARMGVGEAPGATSEELQARIVAGRQCRLTPAAQIVLPCTNAGRLAASIGNLAGCARPEWQHQQEALLYELPES